MHAHAKNGKIVIIGTNNGPESLPGLVFSIWERDMFYFSPERLVIGEASPGYDQRLKSDASNLPNVIQALQSDRTDLFDRLVIHLREIFSTVGNLTARLAPSELVEIRVWPTQDRKFVDLSFPLKESGTGVAQAIAILTAIMTVENAVIIIDEINSFLHPSA